MRSPARKTFRRRRLQSGQPTWNAAGRYRPAAGRHRPAQAAALIERALAVAETIPSDWLRSDALASIAERLAVPLPPTRR
jgi:hypothetical protein